MKQYITLFFCIILGTAWAQRPAADQLKTSKGMLSIQPVMHGSLVLTWDKKNHLCRSIWRTKGL
jgi:hypothetical protein